MENRFREKHMAGRYVGLRMVDGKTVFGFKIDRLPSRIVMVYRDEFVTIELNESDVKRLAEDLTDPDPGVPRPGRD